MQTLNKSWLLFIGISIFLLFSIPSCQLSKNIPKHQYLLLSNEIDLNEPAQHLESQINQVIRQKPNSKILGIPLKLIAYNSIDSTKVAKKRVKRNKRIAKKNQKRAAREDKINQRRIQRALDDGEFVYIPKEIKRKDTLNSRPFIKEWIKYEFGEAPRIFDSLTMDVSRNQIQLFTNQKGFLNARVSTQTKYDKEKRTVEVSYIIKEGPAFMIDSFYLVSNNEVLINLFKDFKKENSKDFELPRQLDTDQLGSIRNRLSNYYRDNAIYGFRSSYVTYEIDTLIANDQVKIALRIAPRTIQDGDKTKTKPFAVTRINKVHFHYLDTMSYEGNFMRDEITARNLSLNRGGQIPTFDTLRYNEYKGRNAEFRTAYFYYNGKKSFDPGLLEYQNLLEENNFYRGNYVDQSFNRMLSLELFQSINPVLEENEDNTIDVHYYMTPGKRQNFLFEPRATTSNGLLGINSSINYQHKNLFGGGERLKISFSGGFETQPPIYDQTEDGTPISNASDNFNTIEFGPTVELEIPGLYPVSLSKLSKKQLPKTSISTAFNYQRREDFNRELIQFNYSWKFYDVKQTQVFTVGLPAFGGFQYVNINQSEEFKNRLQQQNDLFLINAYSSQFIWKDIKLIYQYSNLKTKKGKFTYSYGAFFDLAGNTANLITRNQEANQDGFQTVGSVRYAQFVRLDNDIRLNHELKGERSLNYRLQIGTGVPFGNNGPNLPFDYSFFGGGANDNRGFRARALGPGVYKTYLDSTRTATEIGDIRFGGSVEFRYKIYGIFKGAVFADFGNIWTYNNDENRPGGQFSRDWYKQLSLAVGTGLRIDLSFLIFRLDVGIPVRKPSLPNSSQWIFQDRSAYIEEGIEVFGPNAESILKNPFRPQVHFGIGFPF